MIKRQMNSHRKQQGFFGTVDVLVVLGVMTVLISLFANYLNDRLLESEAEAFAKQIERTIDAINAYQSDMYSAGVSFRTTDIFPDSLNDLMPNYLPNCTAVQNADRQCKLPTQTPWGQNLVYRTQLVSVPVPGGTVDVPGFVLEIPAGLEPTLSYRHTYVAALTIIPFARWNEGTGLVTIEYGRLGTEVEHEALLRRDGTTDLLGHWDTGGQFAIMNALDYTIRNANGSQRSLGRGIVGMMVAKHNQYLPVHSCPQGATPDLVTWPKALYSSSTSWSFNETGAVNAYYSRSGSNFIIRLEYWAKRTSNQTWYKYNTGDVAVALVCI